VGRRYYWHEDFAGDPTRRDLSEDKISEEDARLINTYGEIYPYYNGYEILTDINEEIYNKIKGTISKQSKGFKPLSF
jgi:hypothetical protein